METNFYGEYVDSSPRECDVARHAGSEVCIQYHPHLAPGQLDAGNSEVKVSTEVTGVVCRLEKVAA